MEYLGLCGCWGIFFSGGILHGSGCCSFKGVGRIHLLQSAYASVVLISSSSTFSKRT
uniref:Uncharacterized protein n=1 Tax=Arundo donax TaxID=35708 RepID=A0A0A9H551_ARUDO